MAEADSTGCKCTNISIMQLFHQLKQLFPKVPDQIVSKIIQQNYHDRVACETLLQKESTFYMQCYPGALISGDSRPLPQGPISDRCSVGYTEANNAQMPKCQQAELQRPDTGSHGIADGAAAAPAPAQLPTSQKQTINDVKLPLSASHVSPPPLLQDNPHENELSASDSTKTLSKPNRATPEDDETNKCCSPRGCPQHNTRTSLPTLEEKLELSKIPLAQLIREAREKVIERENSARKNGCELTCSESEPCVVGECQPQTNNLHLDSLSNALNPTYNEENVASTAEVPLVPSSSASSIGLHLNDEDPTSIPLSHCDTSPNRSPQNVLKIQHNPTPTPPYLLEDSLNMIPSLNRLAPPSPINYPLKSSFRSDDNRLVRASPNTSDSPQREPTISEQTHVATESPKEYEVAVECVVRPAPGDQQRSFTSVNLTLRPPSGSGSAESALPIDITSGQSLTYTSASFDPRQGYQSHLQIRIGPAGGSVTACRTRFTSPIVHTSKRSSCNASANVISQSRQQVRALLQHQRERKDMLARELRKKKDRLRAMKSQIQAMKLALDHAASTPLVLSKLKADIERLRGECERLTAAVDYFSEQDNRSNLPLGETDEDFYRNIYTGQRQLRAGWSCRVCTFRNHPLLSVCEECEMPRLSLGTTPGLHDHDHTPAPRTLSNPVFHNNNSSPCAAGETSTSVSRTITPLQER